MPRKLALRAALLLAACALAAASVHRVTALAGERAALAETARELGVSGPGLDTALRRAEDPERARIALARALVVAALEGYPGDPEGSPGGGESAARRRRLEEADRLARAVLARRPASWEAATLAGAATYLRWSLDRDPRLLQEYRTWEEPLLLARRLAPVKPDPERYLATAYLELWPALSDAKRELPGELAGEALRDRATFGRLIGPWLEISGGDLTPVPDAPWAWGAVQQALAGRRDWPGFCRAWEARRRGLLAETEARIGEAERMLRAGRLLEGRRALLEVVASAPTDRAFAAPVDRALLAAPHGPTRPALRPRFARWLTWSLDLALRGVRPLSPPALGRLRATVTSDGDGDPEVLAAAGWTYLAADDLAGAERFETRAGVQWSSSWGPYRIEKARLLAARGASAQAREALSAVPLGWREHPAYQQTRHAVSAAAGDRAGAAQARAALDARAASRWPPVAWTWKAGRARLEPLVGTAGDGLSVAVAEAPAAGGAVGLSWDGEVLGCRPARGGETLELRLPIAPGLHLLELEPLASADGPVWPGAVEVLAAAAPAPRPPP
ncbi:MAG TPA: hypothetical protein VLF66_04750 [Thermoanaerobaculia bacterium]|nr:hypothetical protein [Thermoanaerobaculia bacterium]